VGVKTSAAVGAAVGRADGVAIGASVGPGVGAVGAIVGLHDPRAQLHRVAPETYVVWAGEHGQPVKASKPTRVTELGIAIVDRLEQPLKALVPTLVTVLGRTSDAKLEQYRKV